MTETTAEATTETLVTGTPRDPKSIRHEKRVAKNVRGALRKAGYSGVHVTEHPDRVEVTFDPGLSAYDIACCALIIELI